MREIGLNISLETRSGNTPVHKRRRQEINPPDILLTTPEQLALLIATKNAHRFFSGLEFCIFDELHSLVTSKRGYLLSLGLARLRTLQTDLQAIGLSATVSDPDSLRRWLVPQTSSRPKAELVTAGGGAKPEIAILDSEERIPWSGHSSARYSIPDIYRAIKTHRTTLLFVNTRSQAELLFQELWRANEDELSIALHHGSLDASRRRRVEKTTEQNSLRAVVATSTLDLGIDWGDVDMVIHVGVPKGASRLAQRIGRSNHRMDEPSRAILVPANRFEVLECRAALEAGTQGAQDTPPLLEGAMDVLAQHVLGTACAGPFAPDDIYDEIRTAAPYANLHSETFNRVVEFVATGGYALKSYERYARIRKTPDGLWRISNPVVARQYRLNAGTIIGAPMLNVRLTRHRGRGINVRGGPVLGKIEGSFLEALSPGDTFLFSGKVLRFEGIRENECFASGAPGADAKVPYYAGGKFPLSTYLADTVRKMLTEPERWKTLPPQVANWLKLQRRHSILPAMMSY